MPLSNTLIRSTHAVWTDLLRSDLRALRAASLLVPLLFFAFGAWQSHRQHIREANRAAERTVEILDQQARRVFEVQDLVMTQIAERVAGLSWDEIAASADLHQWLKALDERTAQIDVIWLIDPQGRGRNSSRFFPAPDTSRVADRDYFQALRESDGGTFLGEPQRGRTVTNRVFVNVARRRSAPGGAFDGVIVTSLEPDYFANAFKSLALSPDDSISLVREDGTVLARGPEPLRDPLKLRPTSGLLANLSQGEQGTFRARAQIDGVERLYRFRKLDIAPVYVLYGRAMQPVLAGWYRDLLLYGLLAAFAAAGLLATTGVAARRTRQQQAALARLRESEGRYHALFQQSPLGLLLTRVDADGTLSFEEMNPALVQITGLVREQVIGKGPAQAFPGPMGAHIEARYRECISTKQSVEYEVEGEGPNGRFVRRAVLRPILDDTGRVVKLLGTSMDITRSRQLEERLQRSQKMEALAALVSGVAHDFNNLLTVVMGNLDLLRRAKPERQTRLIENAIQAVERGRNLTGQLLVFSRHQTLRPEVVDMKHLISSTHDMLQQSLRGDVEISFELADDLWPVRIDSSQLQVALINLAANARDAMPNGGRFTVAAMNRVLHGHEAAEVVAISISDTGTGMARDVLARAFEPFYTTKEVGRGTGLGLAQVYGFVQQSGGSVEIGSEVGNGTTVTLNLPRAEADQAVSAGKRSDDPPFVQTGKRRVLLVEDNAEVAEVGRAILVERGHEVTVCANVTDALAMLDRVPFDIVCSDLVMPGEMDGLDLARAVRARKPDLPIVLMTGYSEAANTAVSEGFTLLLKPYEPTALVKAVMDGAPSLQGNVIALPRSR
jgi:PAS domain S-box-containing protein